MICRMKYFKAQKKVPARGEKAPNQLINPQHSFAI